MIVGLLSGTTAENAIDGLHAIAPGEFTRGSVAPAAQPEDVEDQLWDHQTLFESGYSGSTSLNCAGLGQNVRCGQENVS